ncbi:MAG TPA: CoB--CoM heterodisulfide reductase subunit B [Euryarchaeota archaeon]|nr:CoB--CoM heterodisulfide reductase subunit B [Euryarchaeota archaeon]
MSYAYFFGCVVPSRYPGVEFAVRWITGPEGLDLETKDISEFSCCPVPGIFYSTDRDTWLALAARNLCLAQRGKNEVMTICNGCFSSLLKATEYLDDPKTRGRTNKVLSKIDKKYIGIPEKMEGSNRRVFKPVSVRHFVDVIYRDVGLDAIKSKVTRPLEGMKVAVHYGCHYLRPTENTTIDDPNNPEKVDEIVRCLGAESVDYEDRLACCGAGGGVRSHVIELANSLTEEKFKNISNEEADVIVTPCPFCLLQFDNAQKAFTKRGIPVIHVAQLMAIAMGVDVKKLGLDLHNVSCYPLLAKIKGV